MASFSPWQHSGRAMQTPPLQPPPAVGAAPSPAAQRDLDRFLPRFPAPGFAQRKGISSPCRREPRGGGEGGERRGGGSVPGCHSPELGSATCPAQPSHRSPSPWPCLGKQQPPGEPRGRVYRCCPHGLLIPNRPLCCEIQTHRAVVTVLGFQRPPAHLPEMRGGG